MISGILNKRLWVSWVIVIVGMSALNSCVTVDRSRNQSYRETKDQSFSKKSEDHALKKRVVILPILDADSATRPESFRSTAHQALILELNRSGQFIALEPSELNLDLTQWIKQGEYKLSDLSKEASKVGINAVLEGKIVDIKVKRKADSVGVIRQMKSVFEIVARVRIASGKSGNEIFNTVKTVTLEDSHYRVAERVQSDKQIETDMKMIEVLVKDAFLEFSPQIIMAFEKVSWEGRIAVINGDRYYLNVGKISGVHVGDLLKVTAESEDVYDPESGGHIGKVPGRQKGTLEVISFFGTDGAIAIIHSGSGFKENDRVEIY